MTSCDVLIQRDLFALYGVTKASYVIHMRCHLSRYT